MDITPDLGSISFFLYAKNALLVLNYTVTSNHIHLLVADGKERDAIPNSIKLIAGRAGILLKEENN